MRVPSGSLSLAFACASALGAAAGGCSGDDAAGDAEDSSWAPTSGSRLQARYLVDGDGARLFVGWYDRLRGEFCRVARAEGTRYYCFPFANPAVYADAACKRPLGVHGACALKYTATARGDARCDNETTALWEEEGEIALADVFTWRQDGCRGPAGAAFGSSLVTTSRRLAEAQLVGGDARPPRGDLRLASRVVRFDDGAVAPAVMLDSHWGRRCSPALTSAGLRCLPDAAVFVGPARVEDADAPAFEDSACMHPAAHADAPACLSPTVALVAQIADGCRLITGAHSLGVRLDPREVFTPPGCARGRILAGHFYQLGAALTLDAFPALVVAERGSSRIRVRTFAAGDGAPVPHLGVRLFDAALGTPCRVVPAGDGVLRCLPVDGPALVDGNPASARFADAACSTPLARMGGPADCLAPQDAMTATSAMLALPVAERSCPAAGGEAAGALGDLEPGRWEVHRLGDRHAGPVYQRSSAGCTEVAAPDARYALGETIAPATFAAFRAE